MSYCKIAFKNCHQHINSLFSKHMRIISKAFNQQVKRNIEKFDEDFMFQLTDEEVEELSKSQIVTLNKGADQITG